MLIFYTGLKSTRSSLFSASFSYCHDLLIKNHERNKVSFHTKHNCETINNNMELAIISFFKVIYKFAFPY